MILLFKPELTFLRWRKVENGVFLENKCEFRPGWYNEIIKNIGNIKKVEAIGYFLYHGGGKIKKPVSILTPEFLVKMEECISFLPEYNDLTFKVARYWLKKFPNIHHFLFCDTAFFANLPEQTSTYGIPYALRKKGIKRYGGYGLCHQWAWEQAQSFSNGSTQKILSVYLGNHTNIAAIKNGKPLETTIGFTPVEGILSSNSCGYIDSSIIFELLFKGMSFGEINQLLSEKSGFSGFLGKKCSFLDVVQNKDEQEIFPIREIFRYNIIKNIGAFISILGGIDAVIFISEYLEESMDFILEICHKLEFLGLKCKIASDKNKKFRNSAKNSSDVKVFYLKYDKWEVMAKKVENSLKGGKVR